MPYLSYQLFIMIFENINYHFNAKRIYSPILHLFDANILFSTFASQFMNSTFCFSLFQQQLLTDILHELIFHIVLFLSQFFILVFGPLCKLLRFLLLHEQSKTKDHGFMLLWFINQVLGFPLSGAILEGFIFENVTLQFKHTKLMLYWNNLCSILVI